MTRSTLGINVLLTHRSSAGVLVAEADAEDGFFSGEGFYYVEGDAGFGGRAGAGGEEDAVGVEGEGFGGGDLVVAEDALFDAELAVVLDQVVGEGVVVIDDEEHGGLITGGMGGGSSRRAGRADNDQ